MESELGMPLDEVFDDFGQEAAAAASLAQVYRARLRDTGEWVAVKVRRTYRDPNHSSITTNRHSMDSAPDPGPNPDPDPDLNPNFDPDSGSAAERAGARE